MALYNSQSINSGITKTITIYSAASDTVSFTDLTGSKTVTTNASGEGSVSINYISGQIITFTSSVAKNPNNLSEDYKKSIQILDTTTEVYVMPNKNVLYWYGYESSNLEDCTNANGWSRTGYTFTAPTRNTNYLAISSTNNNYSMVGTKNAISANTIHIIALGLTIGDGSNTYGLICIPSSITSKTFGSPPYATNSGITQNVIAKYDMDTSSYSAFYTAAGSSFLKTSKLYAFWYDDNDDDLLNDKADKTDIAPVESSTTASRAYAVGQQFYLNGSLYKAKAAIAQGATFTIGTNCELADCLTEQINRTVVFNRTKAVNLKDTSVYDARYNKWFTVPDDGYVYIGCETAGFSLLLVISDSTQDVNISNHTYSELYKDKCADLIFVKRGMYLAMDSVQSNVTGFSYDFQYRPIY